jgi:endonuclease/exonuclease/phosphatase family metal-dependent hydrolase
MGIWRRNRSHPEQIFLCLLVIAVAASGCGASPVGPSAAGRGSAAFTVMTFNIQHGLDFNGRYNLQGDVDTIARVQPDLVALQEVTRNDASYRCEDQPQAIAQGLQQATGRTWRVWYQQEWFTPDRSCQADGTGDGPETEGLAFLAPASVEQIGFAPLVNTGLAMAARSGGTSPIVSTHLASGATQLANRTTQVSQLLGWTPGVGMPHVVVGDFNARPDAPEIQPLLMQYRDAWADALAMGTAAGVMSGDTRIRGGRIDYVLYAGDALTVLSAEIVDTLASDHRPLIVRFGRK